MRLRAVGAGVLLGLAVVGCSDGGTLEEIVADEEASSAPTGAAAVDTTTTTTTTAPVAADPTTTVGTGVEVRVFDLEVGNCFDDPADESLVGTVTLVACDVAHDNEVFALFELTGDAYPGEEAVRQLAETGCIERFPAYVGVDYPSSALQVAYLYPLEREWTAFGDRGVACLAYRLDGQPLTATVAGSGL